MMEATRVADETLETEMPEADETETDETKIVMSV
jgi:hypothetical protein